MRRCRHGATDRNAAPCRSDATRPYDGWQELYEDNVGWVYRVLYARVGNRADAEDLTSEVFLAALRPLRIGATRAERSGRTSRRRPARCWRSTGSATTGSRSPDWSEDDPRSRVPTTPRTAPPDRRLDAKPREVPRLALRTAPHDSRSALPAGSAGQGHRAGDGDQRRQREGPPTPRPRGGGPGGPVRSGGCDIAVIGRLPGALAVTICPSPGPVTARPINPAPAHEPRRFPERVDDLGEVERGDREERRHAHRPGGGIDAVSAGVVHTCCGHAGR